MAEARHAWVMDVGDGVAVAAGAAHVVEYLLAADPMPVPRTPEHCAGLIVWRERLIPVIDLARLLTGRDNTSGPHRRAVILAYQQAAGEPLQYGALFVTAAPTQTLVSDDMACALPDGQPALPHIARACFSNRDQAVAILDPRRLFDQPLPGAAAPATDTEPVTIDHDAHDSAPAIGHEPVSEPPHLRATADVVPYLRIVPPATPAAVESAPSVPADAGDPESAPWPPEAVPAETIDIEWPAAVDDLTEPVPADSGADLPLTAETPSTADLAPLPGALPDDAGSGVRAGTEPIAASPRAGSNAVRSFERLHDLERRHTPAANRSRWWLAAVAALLLVVVVIGVWSLTAPVRTPAPDAADSNPPEMVQDAAALAVPPALVPSTPAQPPK